MKSKYDTNTLVWVIREEYFGYLFLMRWIKRVLPSVLTLGARDMIYCNGSDYRDILLTAPYNWIIEDDVLDCDNVFPCTSQQQNINDSPFEEFWGDAFDWSLGEIPPLCHDVLINESGGFQVLDSSHK